MIFSIWLVVKLVVKLTFLHSELWLALNDLYGISNTSLLLSFIIEVKYACADSIPIRNIVSLLKLTSAYGTNWQSTVCTKQFAIESSNCFESKCAVDSITNKAAVRKLVGERLTSLRHRHVGAVLRPLGPAAKLPGSNTSPTEQLTAPKLSIVSLTQYTHSEHEPLQKFAIDHRLLASKSCLHPSCKNRYFIWPESVVHF